MELQIGKHILSGRFLKSCSCSGAIGSLVSAVGGLGAVLYCFGTPTPFHPAELCIQTLAQYRVAVGQTTTTM